MKLVVALVFLLICLLASCSIKTQSGTGLKGKVRSKTIYGYDVEHPENKEWTYKIIETYNELGKQTSEQFHSNQHGKDSVFISSIYVYNLKGQKTRVLDNQGKETGRYEYSDNGLVEKNWFQSTLSQIIRKDKKGNILEKLNYDAAGKYQYKISYRYINSRKVEEDRFTKEGDVNYKGIVTYDKRHDKLDEIIFNPDGSRSSHEKCSYDNAGNLVAQIDSNLQYIGGLPMNNDGGKIYSRHFTYNIVDKNGNWLQQSYLINEKFVLSIKRQLEYY